MASSLKVGSAWKQITGLSTKVGGNWKTASAAYTKVGGVWKQWYAPVVIDDFNRSTSGNLGTTTSGATWTNLRQSWYANGSSGQSDAAATSYAIATVGFGNVKFSASAGVSNGTGLAFWIQDANNWYAAYAFQTSTSSSGPCNPYDCAPCLHTTTYTPSDGTYPSCTCGVKTASSTTYSCPTQNCTTVTTTCSVTGPINLFSGVCPDGYSQAGRGPAIWCGTSYPQAAANYSYCYRAEQTSTTDSSFCYGSSSSVSGSCCCGNTVATTTTATTTAGECNACSAVTYCDTYSTCYQTCTTTTTTWALRLIKMTAGTVAVATTDVSLPSAPVALKVNTESGNVEVQAFSDTGMATQIGSTLSFTPTAQGPGQSVGVIKAPSDAQGSTVDNLLVVL